MEFTLFYKGKIPSQKDRLKTKHELRLVFHKQLKKLFELPPLKHHCCWLNEISCAKELHYERDNKKFFSLVSHELNMYVDIRIQLFSKYKNKTFKDIDNKLKIIFDALQVPEQKNSILPGWSPEKDESPLICLLSNDRLIYKLNVDTDYILGDDFFESKEMACLIKVKI